MLTKPHVVSSISHAKFSSRNDISFNIYHHVVVYLVFFKLGGTAHI